MVETQLTMQEKRLLLAVARETIDLTLKKVPLPPLPEVLPDAVSQIRGAFVTLNKGRNLRGCIGTFRSDRPLIEVVRDMAISAALHDPRFPQVRANEFKDIDIEISALTPLTPVSDPETIEVGRDGLYITRWYYSGVLLPQVATEYGWTREEFLAHTCVKAGLPSDAWLKGATIERFSAEVFSEKTVEN